MEAPYYQAARFPTKKKAGEVYFPLQQLLLEEQGECDLSVYRIQLEQQWHVVVLGKRPSETFHLRIEVLLTTGELVSIREDMLRYLQHRRTQATQLGPWVEGHYDHSEEEQ